MTDVFSKEKRSEVMSKIRSESRLEDSFCLELSRELYRLGYRYRRNYSKLPGRPDVAFVRQKLAIFIDGDFWHGYKLTKQGKSVPKKYWLDKIQRNMQRDRAQTRYIRKLGWKVMRFWEHDFKKGASMIINKIKKELESV